MIANVAASANARVYLDNNATTPMVPEVIDAMLAVLQAVGNPSSKHADGDAARARLGRARQDVAQLFGASPAEIVFTSGASEANHTALAAGWSAMQRRFPERRAIVVSAIEHPSVLAAAQALEARGAQVRIAPVDADGVLDVAAYGQLLDESVAIASVMWANNETGAVQPVARAAQIAHAAGALFHTDATQACGKIALDVRMVGADYASASAHKLHGPAGVGALYVRKGAPFEALLPGSQERGRRAGTENLAGIVGFAAAAQRALARLVPDAAQVQALRDAFEREVIAVVPMAVVNAAGAQRLPNTSNVRIARNGHAIDSDLMLIKLDHAGISVSSGAACSAGENAPSHVLKAMGQSDAEARASLRFSFSALNTLTEAEAAAHALARIVLPLVCRAA